jgi:hypothetical protein
MNSIRNVAITLMFLLFPCPFVRAEEQAGQLPEDGWWIRYFTTSKLESISGNVREYTIKATYSLVGTVVENGEKCRWVEVNSIFTRDGKDGLILSKFLISEKDLLESEEPLDTIKRGWFKSGNNDVRAVEAGKGITRYNTRTVIFPGLWHKAEQIDKEQIVDYQQGKFTILEAKTRQVTSPTTVVKTGRKVINQKDVVEYTGWFHRTTSPFIAAAKIQTKIYYDDQWNTTFNDDVVLQDYGKGAKSSLPENN